MPLPPMAQDTPSRSAGRLRAHLRVPLYRTGYSLLVATATTSLLGIVYWGLAARLYPADEVGLASGLISAMVLVAGLCQLGLGPALTRFVPVAGRATRRLVLTCYAVVAAATAVGALVLALSSPLWSDEFALLADDPAWTAGFVAATIAWGIFQLQDSVLTGMREAPWVVVENASYSAAKIPLLAALSAGSGTALIFTSWTVPAAVAVLPVTLLIFRRLIPRHGSIRPDPTVDRRHVVRFVAGNYPALLFYLGSNALLPLIVTSVEGAETNAYFFIGWTISNVLQLIPLNFMTSLTVEGAFDEQALHEHARRALAQTLRLLVPLVGLVVAAAPLILRVFGDAYADEATSMLRLLAVAAIPNALVALQLSVARVRQQATLALLPQAGLCVAGLSLSWVLLDTMGLPGIGVAWLVAQSAVALAVLPYLARTLRWRAAG